MDHHDSYSRLEARVISGEPLSSLCQTLGIDRSAVIGAEVPDRIQGTFPVLGARVSLLTNEHFQELAGEYGETLTLQINIDLQNEFTFNGVLFEAELSRLVAAALTTPFYQVILTVDKAALLRRALDDSTTPCTVLYFHHEAAAAALQSGFRQIQATLWTDTTKRLVLLVLDQNLRAQGDLISLIGGSHLSDATTQAPPSASILAIAQRAPKRRDDYIGWDALLVSDLTPWHFSLSEVSETGSLVSIVDGILVALAVLFTCDRARVLLSTSGTLPIQAEFRSRESVVYVPFNEQASLDAVSDEQRKAIRRVVDWCYQIQSTGEGQEPTDWLEDRLPFVQTCVARALAGRPSEERLRAFATDMPQLFASAHWQWRSFLEGRVSDFMDRVQKLEESVATAVEGYAGQSAALVSGLSSTILAAVAALIGSFIAATFSRPFNARLFEIGMTTYASYVLFFPCILGLLAASGQAKQLDASFAALKRHFEDMLYPEKVAAVIGGRIKMARDGFNTWRTWVLFFYLIVVGAAYTSAILLPNYVVH